MGLLIEGKWHDEWYDTAKSGGRFVRSESQFRHWITPDGSNGPTGDEGFRAEAGRYHLYVSPACPWSHRTMIFRKLKGLERLIDMTAVHPHMLEYGWSFAEPEPLYGFDYVHQLYTRDTPDYTGRVSVPLLWDKKRQRIVSNESSEIIRMFNSAFDGITGNSLDFYPRELRPQIDAINDFVYDSINNGVYRCGFATSQEAYEEAFTELFRALDRIESILDGQRYLAGSRITEADWRILPTLVRFDAVYFGHFKCNLRRIADYPNLANYLRELYQYPGVAETVDIGQCKQHYYYSHATINPTRIVPKGPEYDFTARHDRERFEQDSVRSESQLRRVK